MSLSTQPETMQGSIAGEFKGEGFGSVSPPPDLSSILELIRKAADAKESVVLSPAEARVLTNHLST